MAMEDFTALKTCPKCGVAKPVSEYQKNKSKKSGFCTNCKPCVAEYNRSRYLDNQEEIKARCRSRYETHGDLMRAAKKVYAAANAESIAAKKADWAKANRHRILEWKRARRIANPQSGRVDWQNRRARKINNGGRLSPGLAKRLFFLQRGKCPCCKQPLGANYHLDHKMPLALGGTNTDDNMQLMRAVCNQKKHAKHPIDFMQSRGFLL